MKADYFRFMQGVLDKRHAEGVPESDCGKPGQVWFLPHFGVYHPRKPSKIRVVFDPSTEHMSVSLNSVLLTRPDQTNSMLGILYRFR